MTPNKEMIAMAERIGRNTNLSDIFAEARRRMIGDVTQMGIDHHIATVAGERAAITAIMEVTEAAANLAEGWNASREDRVTEASIAEAIRNGDHLR